MSRGRPCDVKIRLWNIVNDVSRDIKLRLWNIVNDVSRDIKLRLWNIDMCDMDFSVSGPLPGLNNLHYFFLKCEAF